MYIHGSDSGVLADALSSGTGFARFSWCVFVLVVVNVPSADDCGITMTTLSHMVGGHCQRSDWPLGLSQGARLMAPPMSVLGHTAVSFRNNGELYISSVFFRWNSLDVSLVTVSLLFAAPV